MRAGAGAEHRSSILRQDGSELPEPAEPAKPAARCTWCLSQRWTFEFTESRQLGVRTRIRAATWAYPLPLIKGIGV